MLLVVGNGAPGSEWKGRQKIFPAGGQTSSGEKWQTCEKMRLLLVVSAVDETGQGAGHGPGAMPKQAGPRGTPGVGGEGPGVEGAPSKPSLRPSWAVGSRPRNSSGHSWGTCGSHGTGVLVEQGACLGGWVLSKGGHVGPACLPLSTGGGDDPR